MSIKFSLEITIETKEIQSNYQSITEELTVDGIRHYSKLIDMMNMFKNIKILILYNLLKDLEVTTHRIHLPKLEFLSIGNWR